MENVRDADIRGRGDKAGYTKSAPELSFTSGKFHRKVNIFASFALQDNLLLAP